MRFHSSLAFLSLILMGTSFCTTAQPPSENPPENAPTSFASVYTARVDGGIDMDSATLEAIAREKGTLEYVEFASSHGPEWHVDRKVVRPGDRQYAYPGFTLTVHKGRINAKARGKLAKVQGKPQESRITYDQPGYEMIQTVPDSDTQPGRGTIRYDGRVTGEYTVTPSGNHGRGKRWPHIVRLDLPEKNKSIIQVIEYGLGIGREHFKGLDHVTPNEPISPPQKLDRPRPSLQQKIQNMSDAQTITSQDIRNSASGTWTSGASEGPQFSWDTSSIAPGTNGWIPAEEFGVFVGFYFGANLSASVSGVINLDDSDRDRGVVSIDGTGGSFSFNYGSEFVAKLQAQPGIIDDFEFDLLEPLGLWWLGDLRLNDMAVWENGVVTDPETEEGDPPNPYQNTSVSDDLLMDGSKITRFDLVNIASFEGSVSVADLARLPKKKIKLSMHASGATSEG
jgi:hypothetical protein